MKKLNVLLSAYNGKNYLRTQLESLVNQDYPNFTVHIRDDGSIDESYDICSCYCNGSNKWKLFRGENIGVFDSFMYLLRNADNDAGYYAFCDQDDFWNKDKLSKAVSQMETFSKLNVPLLYFSTFLIADENLNLVKKSEKPRCISFESALVENVAPGCTIVINDIARTLLLQDCPIDLHLHDWWYYLVISAFGKIIFDPLPSMIYRMHKKNVSYGEFGLLSILRGRFKRIQSGDNVVFFKQAESLLSIYRKQLPKEKVKTIEEFIAIPKLRLLDRLKIAIKNPYHRQLLMDDLFMRFYYLFVTKNA